MKENSKIIWISSPKSPNPLYNKYNLIDGIIDLQIKEKLNANNSS